MLSTYNNVAVINADILKLDINRIVNEKNSGRPIKVVANLPYYTITPIIMGLFEKRVPFENITIMVQKEVAECIVKARNKRLWSALACSPVSLRAAGHVYSARRLLYAAPEC